MEPQTPKDTRKSLREQISSTSELLKSLTSPNTPTPRDTSRASASFLSADRTELDCVPEVPERAREKSEPQSQKRYGVPVSERAQFSPPETVLKNSATSIDNYSDSRSESPDMDTLRPQRPRRDAHRMSMYSVQGELTYQRDAERQLMAAVAAARREVRGDILLVLLERVAAQAVSLYNTASIDTAEDIDALCVSLADYVRRYADQASVRLEQELSAGLNLREQRSTAPVERQSDHYRDSSDQSIDRSMERAFDRAERLHRADRAAESQEDRRINRSSSNLDFVQQRDQWRPRIPREPREQNRRHSQYFEISAPLVPSAPSRASCFSNESAESSSSSQRLQGRPPSRMQEVIERLRSRK